MCVCRHFLYPPPVEMCFYYLYCRFLYKWIFCTCQRRMYPMMSLPMPIIKAVVSVDLCDFTS